MTSGKRLRVFNDGVLEADVPNEALTDEAPLYDRPWVEPRNPAADEDPLAVRSGGLFLDGDVGEHARVDELRTEIEAERSPRRTAGQPVGMAPCGLVSLSGEQFLEPLAVSLIPDHFLYDVSRGRNVTPRHDFL